MDFWRKPEKNKTVTPHQNGIPSLSIIIPVRNEEKNILRCLNSIIQNVGFDDINPQIIVVDDHSEDCTVQEVESLNNPKITLLHLSEYLPSGTHINAYKKAAINYANEYVINEYVLQLDGDTVVPRQYLSTLTKRLRDNDSDFMAMPVFIAPDPFKRLTAFQSLDMAGMMGLTRAGIESSNWYMANGANMAYKKQLITFDPQDSASGDDVFGILQARQKEALITYAYDPELTITTWPETRLSGLWRQRMRWATKNKTLNDGLIRLVMLIPLTCSLCIIAHIPAIVLYGSIALVGGTFLLFIKLIADYIYLKHLQTFFPIHKSMQFFLAATLIHTIYIAMVGIGSLVVTNYTWKSRRLR